MIGITNGFGPVPTSQKIQGLPILDNDGVLLPGDMIDLPFSKSLESCSWEEISNISSMGLAGDYFSVGDTKSVALSGNVGTLSLDTTLYVFIIGINHRGVNGVTFQGFKTAATGGIDVALVTNYDTASSNGTKNFNMNHWGATSYGDNFGGNYGGWKGCDLRYDILGSTDTAPSSYGSANAKDRVGYDASSTTATNPVSNTLMAALPSSLRAIMRPMTVYTSNDSSTWHTDQSVVSTSIDYLPLPAVKEVYGSYDSENPYEDYYQSTYSYYEEGNSLHKYQHSATTTISRWWLRSPVADELHETNSVFHSIMTYAGSDSYPSPTGFDRSLGLAPMFLV